VVAVVRRIAVTFAMTAATWEKPRIPHDRHTTQARSEHQ
jgi:hypothetical protein